VQETFYVISLTACSADFSALSVIILAAIKSERYTGGRTAGMPIINYTFICNPRLDGNFSELFAVLAFAGTIKARHGMKITAPAFARPTLCR